MKTCKKLLAVAISVLIIASCLSGCAGGGDTLVVGYDPFSEKFSPFFATTAYDMDVMNMTQIPLLGYDREANIVLKGIEGETRPYNGNDYTYKGIADCTINQEKDANGSIVKVVYDFKLREDIKFADGEPLTADDVIFSMYVYSDTTYDGSTQFYSLPIIGMNEYRSGMSVLADMIVKAGEGNADYSYWTAEQQEAFWTLYKGDAVTRFAQSIVDYVYSNYPDHIVDATGFTEAEVAASDGLKVAFGMAMWGFGKIEEKVLTTTSGAKFDLSAGTYPTAEDYKKELLTAYNNDIAAMEGVEAANMSMLACVKELNPSFAAAVKTGESADKIEGIAKTGEYSFTVTMSEFDATAIYQFNLSVAPLHYYGSNDMYDYENNKFGFTKGDLSAVKSKTTQPLGAGPYKFINFENGVVSFEANENYYEGKPVTKYVKFQEVTVNSDKVAGLIAGTLDISDPSLTSAIIDAIKAGNSNGELTGKTITYHAIDNNGYGYIGIDATRVKVGEDPSSNESKALRKGFATLFAAYRDTAVNSYYGERASVIQYPITNTSWAAPRPSDEGYKIAYSTSVDGNPIYTEGMNEEDKYQAALNASIEYFKTAGYTWDEAAKKFTAAPEGSAMAYEIIIPGDGIGDHPSYGILTATKGALASIGITLEINDPADGNELWDGLDGDTVDMWAAAWGAALDPDMYQTYHSDNAYGNKSNHYNITDAKLDSLIVEARASDNNTYRKGVYKECLEIMLDWAVEIPVYQRQNCFVFSTTRVNVETLPNDMTPYWGWINGIDKIELK